MTDWMLDRYTDLGDKIRDRYVKIHKQSVDEFLKPHGLREQDIEPKHTKKAPEGSGPLFHNEGVVLVALGRQLGGPVLELGSERGISTRYIMEGLQEYAPPHNRVYAVDIRHQWRPRIVEDPLRQRHELRMDSRHLNPIDIGAVQWAFIDGDHLYAGVKNDTEKAIACGAQLLIYHDCSPWIPRGTGAGQGSDAFEAATDILWDDPNWDLTFIKTVAGLLLATKHGDETNY